MSKIPHLPTNLITWRPTLFGGLKSKPHTPVENTQRCQQRRVKKLGAGHGAENTPLRLMSERNS